MFVALFYLALFFVNLRRDRIPVGEMQIFLVISMIVVDEAKKEHWHVEPGTGGGVSAYTLGSVVLQNRKVIITYYDFQIFEYTKSSSPRPLHPHPPLFHSEGYLGTVHGGIVVETTGRQTNTKARWTMQNVRAWSGNHAHNSAFMRYW